MFCWVSRLALLPGAGAAVVRSVNLLKIAAEAEVLRYRCMAARQGRRAAFGAIALLFVLAVLVLGGVAAWLEGGTWQVQLASVLDPLATGHAVAAVFSVTQ